MPTSVSIVVPSLNQGRYVGKTLDSLLGQAYPALEIIVCDGGSTDSTLEELEKRRTRIARIISEKDKGQSDAINKGLHLASGELVGWLNSDDMLDKGALKALVNAYEKNNKRPGLYYGYTSLIDESDKVLHRLVATKADYNSLTRFNRNIFSQPGTLWPTALHAELGFLNQSLHCTMDCDWFIRVAQRYPLVHVRRPVSMLRQHGETKSSKLTAIFNAEHDLLDEVYQPREPGLTFLHWRFRRILSVLTSPSAIRFKLYGG